MNYDRIFDEDINRKFFYTDYPGNKIMVGRVSLKNAIARLNMNEYYVLVNYHEGEELPREYMPLPSLTSEDGTLFATYNPKVRFFDICMNGGIQRVSRLMDLSSGSPNYLLGTGQGPGPETLSLEEMVMEQYEEYVKEHTNSAGRGR